MFYGQDRIKVRRSDFEGKLSVGSCFGLWTDLW